MGRVAWAMARWPESSRIRRLFNLTRSSAPDDYIEAIINKGGAAMGRSERMPPWGKDLSVNEVKSVVLYNSKTLRE